MNKLGRGSLANTLCVHALSAYVLCTPCVHTRVFTPGASEARQVRTTSDEYTASRTPPCAGWRAYLSAGGGEASTSKREPSTVM